MAHVTSYRGKVIAPFKMDKKKALTSKGHILVTNQIFDAIFDPFYVYKQIRNSE